MKNGNYVIAMCENQVSNLSFVSKIIGKVILSQLFSHLSTSQLFNPFQSAYRPGLSTETALLKVMNDLLHSLDHGSMSVLNFLDLIRCL